MSGDALPASAQRVQAVLAAHGLDLRVVTFPESTRTAEDAATAIGCAVAQIAKSLIFKTKSTDRPVLVVASGPNRVKERAVEAALADALGGERIGRADADFVRAKTGFAIGGVPPVAHAEAPLVVIDADLLDLGEVWAAAGTPNAVFRLTPADLVTLTGGVVTPIA